MSSSFLQLSEALSLATTQRDKKKLSKELSAFLSEDSDFSSLLLHSLVMEELRDIAPLAAVLNSEFFTIRHKVYEDEDGKNKVAVGLTYLQPFDGHLPELDSYVMQALVKAIGARNLELLVNDITVNSLQVRNGEVESLL